MQIKGIYTTDNRLEKCCAFVCWHIACGKVPGTPRSQTPAEGTATWHMKRRMQPGSGTADGNGGAWHACGLRLAFRAAGRERGGTGRTAVRARVVRHAGARGPLPLRLPVRIVAYRIEGGDETVTPATTLLAHYGVRCLVHEAANKAGEDPDRMSFVHAVRVMRRRIINPFPPRGPADRRD